MSVLLFAALAAALANPAPLALEVAWERDALQVSFRLLEPLPDSIESTLPSGAMVRVRYPLRVRVPRKLWWDRKLWKGEAVSTATFDPVTGRYRCELVLDDVIVSSREVETAAAARNWLASPGPVRLALPPPRRGAVLRVRVRAIFASSTTWLIFPSTQGTSWVELPVASADDNQQEPAEPAEDTS